MTSDEDLGRNHRVGGAQGSSLNPETDCATVFGNVRASAREKMTANRVGVLMIFGGTAGGQLFALLAAPVLSRMYSPSDFGIFAIVSAFIVTFGTVASLRFDAAIPLPEADRDAHGLVVLGLCSVLATTAVGFGAVMLFGTSISSRFQRPDMAQWLWFVPITAGALGAYLVLNQLAIRQQRFGAIGRRNALHQATVVCTQIAAGAAGVRPGGLILGLTVGQSLGAVSLLRGAKLRCQSAREARTVHNIRALISRFRRFPLVFAPAGLLSTLGLQLPLLLVALLYGSAVAGWLGFTQRVLALPVTLLGAAVAQVFVGELARAARGDPGRVRSLFVSTSRRLAIVGLIVAGPFVVLGPQLFSLVFGSAWLHSGQYAQALAVSLATQLVAAPLSPALVVFERQFAQLMWDGGRLGLTSSVVAISAATDQSALFAVWALGISSAACYVTSWLLSWQTIRSRVIV